MYMKYVHVHLLGINDLGIACLCWTLWLYSDDIR